MPETIVTLTYKDLLELSEYFNKEDKDIAKYVGQGSIEYLLFKFIKDKKGIDFFKEEEKLFNHP